VNQNKKQTSALLRAAAATVASLFIFHPALAPAGTATNTAGPVQQGQSNGGTGDPALNNPAVTISFAGQTALKSFFISPAVTELQPGTSIILHDGTDGAPVEYIATNTGSTSVQLASKNFTTADKNPGTPTDPSTSSIQVASAIQLQWHEEGSIDGFVDLLNDEIGYPQTTAQAAGVNTINAGSDTAGDVVETVGPLSQESLRTPTTPNPTVVNETVFAAGGTSSTGFSLDASASDLLNETYNTNVYTPATGVNIQGGQNRIQFSIGEYPTEALSVAGTASVFATPGSPGYGQGNPALPSGSIITALGTSSARQSFQPATAADESTSIDDPQTGSAYSAGPWNTAGANNITSTPFAVTAVTYSANAGTGLLRLDNGDAQWLQTTGRLQNGELFNVVARTVNTGQRTVFALATGIDPTWAVGSNDDGNSTTTAAANAQHSIGPSLRFDGKTSGSEAAATIAVSRMAVGALSVPEATAAAGPIRALNIDFNDQTDVNSADDSNTAVFVSANFNTIVSDGSAANGPHYAAVLISHVNSVKAANPSALLAQEELDGYLPSNDTNVNDATNTSLVSSANQATAWSQVNSFDPTYAESDYTTAIQGSSTYSASTDPVTGIKGDTTGDVAAFISNIVNSDGTAAAGLSPSSANDPADGLFSLGYLIPGLLDYTRTVDGGSLTPVQLSSAALAEQQEVEQNYGSLFNANSSSSEAQDSNTVGSSGSFYGATSGNGTVNGNGVAINGAIPITAKDVTWVNGTVTTVQSAGNGDLTAEGGNYLFGNFNQNGVRDYSDVQQAVNAALSLYAVDGAAGGSNSIFTSSGGVPNNTVIPSLVGDPGWQQTATNTKGDLITLGDYNGDGAFDGQDLYLLAIGASLADSTSSNTLTATVSNFSDVVRNPDDVLRKNAALNYINNYLSTTTDTTGAAFLRQTARAVLEGASVPSGATNLGTTDPVNGLDQYTYDPTGANAFNPNDVNRDGVVDFNDAVLVDQYYGQSYENLTQSLAATEPTPVTGVTEPLSLVVVQQVDGESAIGAADLSVENAGLTGVGNANWYGYNLQKTGPGTIIWGRTGGTVTVYPGASFEISNGVVQIGGTLDPFSDNNVAGATTTVGNHVAVAVDSGAKLQYIQSGGTSTVASLSVDTTTGSVVDVGATTLNVQYGAGADPTASIVSYLASGYNGGAWNGAGINSSAVAAANLSQSALIYSVGYADGADGITGVPSGTVEILPTLAGDAKLQGNVVFGDFQLLSQYFGQSGTSWDEGNFTYGSTTNFGDFQLLSQNFGQSASGLTAGEVASLNSFASQFGEGFAANGDGGFSLVSVPEPASAGLLALAGCGFVARRRRKQD
jgi:hypothetical protein